MGSTISSYVNGATATASQQIANNGQNAIPTNGRSNNNNRRLRNRIRRGRRAGQARSSGLFSIDAESGVQKVDNAFRYPPADVTAPYLGSAFLLGVEKYDRPTLTSPLSDATYAFGDNYDLNFLAGKSNTVNLPLTVQDLSEPTVPLRALVNIRRDSLKLTKCKLPPDNHPPTSLCYNLEFVFDALVKCCITVYYICQESFNDAEGMRFIAHPQAAKFTSSPYTHTAGAAQHFYHPDHVFDAAELKIFSIFADKPKNSPSLTTDRTNSTNGAAKRNNSNSTNATVDAESGTAGGAVSVEMSESAGGAGMSIDATHFLPMVVHCVALEEDPSDGNYVARQSHATFLFLERANDASNEFVLKYIKQKVWIGGASFLLQEVFGIENKQAGLTTNPSFARIARGLRAPTADADDGSDGVNEEEASEEDADDDEDEEESGNDCAICMSEPRDTMILPCRHLCICSQCAESLRYQANNCPICRAPFKYLIQLRAYLRQTEEQQQAELAAAQAQVENSEQRPGEIKVSESSAANSAPGSTAVAAAATLPNSTTVVITERQPSIVPGDSDADDDTAVVDLGKKKSRDRIEPPGFAGLVSCALIDTLNGTKQDYEALRTATAEHFKKQHSAIGFDTGRVAAVRVLSNDRIASAQSFNTARSLAGSTAKQIIVSDDVEHIDSSSSESDENAEQKFSHAPDKFRVGEDAESLNSKTNLDNRFVTDRGSAIIPVELVAEEVGSGDAVSNQLKQTRSTEISAHAERKFSNYDSSMEDEGNYTGLDDSVQQRVTLAHQAAAAIVRNPRSGSVGTGTAVLRSGSGHSNEVLLTGERGDPANLAKSPRKY